MSKAITPDHLLAIVVRRKDIKKTEPVPGFIYCDDVDALVGALSEATDERDRMKAGLHDALIELGVITSSFSIPRDLRTALDSVLEQMRAAYVLNSDKEDSRDA
jgi:hypothetical protein